MAQTDYINPFTDVLPPVQTPYNSSASDIGNVRDMAGIQVGANGGKSFRADQQGIWLGADNFADAPFSVTMDGKMVLKASDSSGAYILIDAVNNRIVVFDGTHFRVVLGKKFLGT